MSETKKVGIFKRIGAYFRNLKSEMKKVTWPTFKQVRNNTGIVLGAVIAIGVLIALLDLGFQGLWMLIF